MNEMDCTILLEALKIKYVDNKRLCEALDIAIAAVHEKYQREDDGK